MQTSTFELNQSSKILIVYNKGITLLIQDIYILNSVISIKIHLIILLTNRSTYFVEIVKIRKR